MQAFGSDYPVFLSMRNASPGLRRGHPHHARGNAVRGLAAAGAHHRGSGAAPLHPWTRPTPSFDEDVKGTLAAGKLADFVVLSDDILAEPAGRLLKVKVLLHRDGRPRHLLGKGAVSGAAYAGKVVVVTGASTGIGRALCHELAPQRPRLVLAARDEKRLHQVAEECRALGAEALVAPTDVTVPDQCRTLVERALARFESLDALVNNAGTSMWARFDEVQDLSVFEALMRVNYLGSVYPTYYALPELKRRRGQIVAVASLAGLTGVPTRTGYAASKHALVGFDSLRVELRGTGVAITVVAPDFVVSEIHRRSLGPDGQPLGDSPMQEAKIMTTEACARMIVRAMAERRRLVVGSLRGKVGAGSAWSRRP